VANIINMHEFKRKQNNRPTKHETINCKCIVFTPQTQKDLLIKQLVELGGMYREGEDMLKQIEQHGIILQDQLNSLT